MSSSSSSTEPRGLRIALVVEYQLVGQALGAALGGAGHQVEQHQWPTTAPALEQLRETVQQIGADVAIALSDLTDGPRLREVTTLVEGSPAAWVVLTNAPRGARWGAVLAAGAVGILPASSGFTELVRAVRQAADGVSVMREGEQRALVDQWHSGQQEIAEIEARLGALTARESEVLHQLYDGWTVRTIAERAGVAEATVRTQVKAILRKLEVSSQLAAVAVYRRAID